MRRSTPFLLALFLLSAGTAHAEHSGLPAGFWDSRVALGPDGGATSSAPAAPAPPVGTVTAAPRVEAAAPGQSKVEGEEPLPKRKPPRSYYTLRGGGDLSTTDTGLSAAIGFPRVDVNYYFTYAPGFDVSPEVSFLYGLGATVPVLGTIVGTELRYQVYQSGRWRVKLFGEPAAVLLFDPEVAVGLRLGAPGVEATWHGMEGGYLHGGLRLSPLVFFSPELLVSLPLVASVGGELQLYENYNLYVELEVGPDIRKASGDDASVYLYVSSMIGVETRF